MDGWGNHWYIATHTQDLTIEELKSRTARPRRIRKVRRSSRYSQTNIRKRGIRYEKSGNVRAGAAIGCL
jgi:hypothetical protein